MNSEMRENGLHSDEEGDEPGGGNNVEDDGEHS
jgi:hypothetical protein